MGKHKARKAANPTKAAGHTKATTTTSSMDVSNETPMVNELLLAQPKIRYRLQVLLYDLRNISKSREAEMRTMSTTDPLYISQPYFSMSEANLLKNSLVDIDGITTSDIADELYDTAESSPESTKSANSRLTVEQAIQSRLGSFFEKRRASGDARPCGPHDMAPVYQSVFGITKDELEDPRFISRLARSGLET
ncbi:Hypothetical protein D9617_5g068250 [Elsinoe fawcettii]|nr:Hypothetical protein D9617_5g068250 [Elsinoe fawcettii]